jgi:hypothetical protein
MKILQIGTGTILWEGADLSGANLSGAHLARADLIVGGHRSDGYAFMLHKELDGAVKLKAGCRYFSIKDAKAHWLKTRKGTQLGKESTALIVGLVAQAKACGWKV